MFKKKTAQRVSNRFKDFRSFGQRFLGLAEKDSPGSQVGDCQIDGALRLGQHQIGTRTEGVHLQQEEVGSRTALMVSPFDAEAEQDEPVKRTPRPNVLGVILKFTAKAATRLP